MVFFQRNFVNFIDLAEWRTWPKSIWIALRLIIIIYWHMCYGYWAQPRFHTSAVAKLSTSQMITQFTIVAISDLSIIRSFILIEPVNWWSWLVLWESLLWNDAGYSSFICIPMFTTIVIDVMIENHRNIVKMNFITRAQNRTHAYQSTLYRIKAT